MKSLVIVESPTKARTIGRYLGSDYVIKASMGHVMDLPKSSLGVDVEHNFEPEYELMKDKKKIISELKSAAKEAQSIILATDPDREGEAIAAHVAELLQKTDSGKTENLKRIVFHEITKEAIEEALKNPRSIDLCLVDAQTARRVLDRLVGYKLSPVLWQKVRRGLSAGRVQSIALRLIVEREKEIEKFKKEQYFTIHVILNAVNDLDSSLSAQNDKRGTEFELIEINGDLPAGRQGKIEVQNTFNLYDGEYKVTKTSIDSQEKADKILNDLSIKEFIVSDVLQKETKRSPAPPYTTSTLQQDASRRLGFNGKRTMRIAQKLYEEGYITYHRTDSVSVATQAVFGIRNFVEKEYGKNYIPEKPRFYQTKQKLAQEAHEAIRPTAVGQITNHKSQITNSVGNDGWRLYELIWKRAVASQMADAIIESTTVFVDYKIQNGNLYRFKANGSVLVFEGFLKINPQALEDKKLPEFKALEKLNLLDKLAVLHETMFPPRYNDASLIKTLEEKGIGRPSTYATIISTIEERTYIEREDRKFIPTSIGVAVNDFLVKNFSTIDDIPFTAEMEGQLDQIASGEKEWTKVMKDFYDPFEKKLEEVQKADRVQIAVEETNEICEKCGSKMVIRTGRFGKFLSCSTFPKCKFSKPLVEETKLLCEKCAGLPAGRQGKIIIKKTKKGRKFYGCSNYPKCDFASWTLPKEEKP